ncbi:MAG: HAD family hydrolase [Desulfobacterales bacterium]
MNHIKAIGFDLFNTLITAEPIALNEAMSRLVSSLQKSGLVLKPESFEKAYAEAAVKFIEKARRNGIETHNRFWISEALSRGDQNIPPDDHRVTEAVDAYFSAFYPRCHLIPGSKEMLCRLKKTYLLGLLSNFTHAPAARKIVQQAGLTGFFHVVLISGELGYRKPHPATFDRLAEQLNVKKDQILYVGDDPEADVIGARQAGLQPVWTTYAEEHDLAFKPSVTPVNPEIPEQNTLRISNWQDLLLLCRKK